MRDLRRTIRQLGRLQIDYANVLAPAHYQVVFSRLGPYEIPRLHDLVYRRREFSRWRAGRCCAAAWSRIGCARMGSSRS
jgi:uncharacterized protein YcaQ